MRNRTYRTALLSTLLLAGCTPRETMPELTDRVFAVAAAQYEQLEGRLTDETLPEIGGLRRENSPFQHPLVGAAGFYPARSGIYMSIPATRHSANWPKKTPSNSIPSNRKARTTTWDSR